MIESLKMLDEKDKKILIKRIMIKLKQLETTQKIQGKPVSELLSLFTDTFLKNKIKEHLFALVRTKYVSIYNKYNFHCLYDDFENVLDEILDKKQLRIKQKKKRLVSRKFKYAIIKNKTLIKDCLSSTYFLEDCNFVQMNNRIMNILQTPKTALLNKQLKDRLFIFDEEAGKISPIYNNYLNKLILKVINEIITKQFRSDFNIYLKRKYKNERN